MSNSEKLFVVVDPSDTKHVALERVLRTGQLRGEPPVIKVFVAVDGEAVDTRVINDNLFRDQSWFETEIRKPMQDAGLECHIEVSWSQEWQKSIVQSAKSFGADRIYLPVHERTNSTRFTFSESKWALLKTADCPVVLIQPGAQPERTVVAAAVNFQTTKEEQKALNESILRWGREVAAMYGAEFHVINAFLDQMNYPDRGNLARQTGLPADKIHVKPGYTDEVVSTIASEIKADLVVMGTLGQNGLITSRRGNTAERVIAALTQDVMVVNH